MCNVQTTLFALSSSFVGFVVALQTKDQGIFRQEKIPFKSFLTQVGISYEYTF